MRAEYINIYASRIPPSEWIEAKNPWCDIQTPGAKAYVALEIFNSYQKEFPIEGVAFWDGDLLWIPQMIDKITHALSTPFITHNVLNVLHEIKPTVEQQIIMREATLKSI